MKKHTGAESEHGFGEVERVLHRQLGEAYVHAIEVGAEVAEHEHRDQAPGDTLYGFMFQRFKLRTDGSRSHTSHDVLLIRFSDLADAVPEADTDPDIIPYLDLL